MESIKVQQRVGADGLLRLHIPVGFSNQAVEVMVIYQFRENGMTTALSLEQLYGICSNDPLVLEAAAGTSDARDNELTGAFD